MIILIFAIIIGLVLFAVVRKLAFPVILVLGAGYLYNQFQEMFSGQGTQVSGSSTAAYQPLAPVPMPTVESTVCKAFEDARNAFTTLKIDFKAAGAEKNALHSDQVVAQVRGKIDRLYLDRNRAVLTAIGWDAPFASQWVARVTNLSTTIKDFGKGAASYATLKVELPCRVPVVVTSEDFPAASRLGETLATVNEGDIVLVSGRFIKHDATMNPPEIAVEWGGPLYGPFGGLWTDAIDAPAFRAALSDVSKVAR